MLADISRIQSLLEDNLSNMFESQCEDPIVRAW